MPVGDKGRKPSSALPVALDWEVPQVCVGSA